MSACNHNCNQGRNCTCRPSTGVFSPPPPDSGKRAGSAIAATITLLRIVITQRLATK